MNTAKYFAQDTRVVLQKKIIPTAKRETYVAFCFNQDHISTFQISSNNI